MALRSNLAAITEKFADDVLAAIRSASIEELLDANGALPTNGTPLRPSRPPTRPSSKLDRTQQRSPLRGRTTASGRLKRRSAEQIGKMIDAIVALLQSKAQGMRAEQMRVALGIDAKEIVRPIQEALESGRIRSRGHKRATTYFLKTSTQAETKAQTKKKTSAKKTSRQTRKRAVAA